MTIYKKNPLLMTVVGANPGRHRFVRRRKVDVDDFDAEDMGCQMCGGPVMYLGHLGNRAHFQCRNCGMQFSNEIQKNPSLGAALAGGLAGAAVTHMLSNPGRGQVDERGARELQLYIENDSQLYHQQFVPIVRNLMKRRASGTYNHEKAAKLFLYLADAGAKKYYQEFGTPGVRIFNLATRWEVAKALRDSFESEAELGNYDKMVWGVSNNPSYRARYFSPSMEMREETVRARTLQGALRKAHTRAEGLPRQFTQPHSSVEVDRVKDHFGYRTNPGPKGKRKITMTIERFAQWVKKQRNPAMWKAFLKKFRGYEKWTHGAKSRKVTLEWQDVPGMHGLWITYDAGKAPESTYIMPKGSPRKGAWKHPWDTMPDIKHDPEAGITINKLRGKSKITDFYHK